MRITQPPVYTAKYYYYHQLDKPTLREPSSERYLSRSTNVLNQSNVSNASSFYMFPYFGGAVPTEPSESWRGFLAKTRFRREMRSPTESMLCFRDEADSEKEAEEVLGVLTMDEVDGEVVDG